jgi:hypothetical protein
MGKSYTPTYRVEERAQGVAPYTYAWRKEDGRPTIANLEKRIMSYAKSLEKGGVNEHLSKNFIPYPTFARIVRQATGEVVATWKAAPFQVY